MIWANGDCVSFVTWRNSSSLSWIRTPQGNTRVIICYKSVTFVLNLRRVTPEHMSVHTREKHNKCLYYQVEYLTSFPFQIHTVKHHRGTPKFLAAKLYLLKVKNRCYFLPWTMRYLFHLVIHKKEHTKEKCFKCKRCGLIVYSWSDVIKKYVEYTPHSSLYFRKGQEL